MLAIANGDVVKYVGIVGAQQANLYAVVNMEAEIDESRLNTRCFPQRSARLGGVAIVHTA